MMTTRTLTIAAVVLGACSRAGAASGPDLDPKKAAAETWVLEDLGPTEMLAFGAARVTLSKSCLKGGALDCDAARTLRAGPVVEVKRSTLDGRMSAGARVCLALRGELVTGKGPSGSEDGFCKLKDGSLVSNGALETYAIKIVP